MYNNTVAGPEVQNIKKGKKFTKQNIWSQRYLLFMSVPFIIWTILFKYLPLWGWTMAFQNYKPSKSFFEQKWGF